MPAKPRPFTAPVVMEQSLIWRDIARAVLLPHWLADVVNSDLEHLPGGHYHLGPHATNSRRPGGACHGGERTHFFC
jgi:hypothetical protein